VIFVQYPRSEGQNFIDFTNLLEFWVDLLVSFLNPLYVPSLENELLFLNLEEVLAIVATHCHN